ncbi:MAG: DNA gyrase C-terminal beta-propeller domain-containing protein, partial [Parvibaculales bacterium]
RKLEEQTIRTEHQELSAEMADLKDLLASESRQSEIIANDIREVRKQFGPKTALGRRRTEFIIAEDDEEIALDMLVEKEPVTIICSQKGWIRAMKGHVEDGSKLTYKDGDAANFVLHAMTTDKLVLFASNGRAYTLDASKLPGGRGNGDPVRLMIDLAPAEEILEIMVHDPNRKLLVASRIGNGFIVAESELISTRKAGKQILNVKAPDEAAICVPAIGDRVAVLGENKKLLCFALADVPEMPRGKGVRLQRHGDGHLADARCYVEAEGLTITDRAGRERVFDDLGEWAGHRAQAGRIRPKGFPTDGLLGPAFKNRL